MFSHVDKYGLNKPKVFFLSAVIITFFASIIFINSAFAVTFNNPLVDAAESGDIKQVRKILDEGSNLPDSKGDFGTTAIMRAAFNGNTEIVKLLIERGASVNSADVGGETALHLAAKNGYVDVVKLLIKKGASVNGQDKEQWTPLMRATVAKHPDVVKILVQNGGDVSAVNNLNESVIINAAKGGSVDILKIIIGSPKSSKISHEQRSASLEVANKGGNESLKKILTDFLDKTKNEVKEVVTDAKKVVTKESEKAIQVAKKTSDSVNKKVHGDKKLTEKNSKKDSKIASKANDVKKAEKKSSVVKKASAEVLPWLKKPVGNAKNTGKKIASADNKNMKVLNGLPWLTNSTADSKTLGEGARKISENKLPELAGSKKSTIFYAELGSYKSDKSAENAWDKILSTNGDVLAKLEPNIVEEIAPGDVSYKLRVGEIGSKKDAESVCRTMKGRKYDCSIVEVSDTQVIARPRAIGKVDKSEKPSEISQVRSEQIKQNIEQNKSTMAMKPDAFMGNYNKIGEEMLLPPGDAMPVPLASLNVANLDAQQKIQNKKINENATKQLPWQGAGPARKEWKLPEEQLSENDINDSVNASPVPYSPADLSENKDSVRNFAQSQTRAQKEYDDFYKEVKNNNKDQVVSEAIPVPDETYFVNKKQSAPVDISSSQREPGTWLNIERLPNEAFANDYGDRMFKYDESLGGIKIKITKSGGAIVMKVGPVPDDRASALCDAVRAGGYGCLVVRGDGAVSAPVAASGSPELSGDFWIDLGTFASSSEAEYYKMFVQEDNSDLLGSLRYEMAESSDSNESGAVRLRTGPFDNKQRALQICGILRHRNVACVVAD